MADRSESKRLGRSLDGVFQEYGEHNARLRELNSEVRENLEETRRLDDDEQRIFDDFDAASSEEDKATLLLEARELQKRRQQAGKELIRLLEEVEEHKSAHEAIKERVDERIENVHIAALETAKMLFELAKLVATLAIGTIVAMSAVTPALLPRLNSLEGLWPAFGWLLTSVVVSVVMCVYSMSQVSQLVAQLNEIRRSRLPRWASRLLGALPYAVLLTFSAGALVIGIGKFVLFVSTNLN